jgi:hypothetical protein
VTSLVPQAASFKRQAASKSQIGDGRSGLASFKIVGAGAASGKGTVCLFLAACSFKLAA